jgi:hypothetical protein
MKQSCLQEESAGDNIYGIGGMMNSSFVMEGSSDED